MAPRPQARSDRLVVREVDGETLVYDLDSHDAHCLNETCGAVWRACDGERDALGIASALALDEVVVSLALEELWKRDLLDGEAPVRETTLSRRKLVRRLGVAAAVPLAATIAAPAASAFVSCLDLGQSCSQDTDCCAGNCSTGGLSVCADLGSGPVCACLD